MFNMDHTEPGAIAGSGVLVCLNVGLLRQLISSILKAIWALSADTCLRDRGDKTNIDYDGLFDQYLEILTVGLRDKSRSIINVFKEWDRIIFPNSESGHGGKTQSGPSHGGNQRALDALRAEKQTAGDDVASGEEHDE
jgi:hypothetical protein